MTVTRLLVPPNEKLYPHQVAGIKFLISRNRILLGSDPGTGKSAQARVAANYIRPTRTLVLCPASVRSTWEYEWSRWATLPTTIQVIENSKKLVPQETDTLILSYDLCFRPKWFAFLKRWLSHFDSPYTANPNHRQLSLLVADEAHQLKNTEAKRSRAVLDFSKHSDRIFLLTGTPIQNHVTELFNLARLCDPSTFYSFEEFANRYSYPWFDGYQTRYTGNRNTQELKQRIKPFFIRHLKADVLKNLPEKLYSNIYIDITTKEAELIFKQTAINESIIQTRIAQGQDPKPNQAQAEILHTLARTKVPGICAWFDNFLECESNESLVIFGYHRDVIQQLHNYFEKKGLCVCSLTGDTLPKDRAYYVEQFQKGTIQVFIGNILAAGEGITLTRSHNVFFTELIWNPAKLSQAADRLHRISQVNKVMIRFFLTKNTVEDKLIRTIQMKMKSTDKVIDSSRNVKET